MPKNDRGMIKWLPFDSVTSGKRMIRDVLEEKSEIEQPVLSNEQKDVLEEKLLLAYYAKSPITVEYFYAGHIYSFKKIIKKIDFINHKIYFNNNVLLFEQIINLY